MKKIPTLFKREFDKHKVVNIYPEVTPGLEWVLEGQGTATVKWDGACCAIYDGKFYKRYDAKKGKTPPVCAMPCCEPDPVTGHWPHWVEVSPDNPADKWFVDAIENFKREHRLSENWMLYKDNWGTYEAVGKSFQGNPYGMTYNTLFKHGDIRVCIPELSFEGIKKFLDEYEVEGVVFWRMGEPRCKIKRTDFGMEWPIREK